MQLREEKSCVFESAEKCTIPLWWCHVITGKPFTHTQKAFKGQVLWLLEAIAHEALILNVVDNNRHVEEAVLKKLTLGLRHEFAPTMHGLGHHAWTGACALSPTAMCLSEFLLHLWP